MLRGYIRLFLAAIALLIFVVPVTAQYQNDLSPSDITVMVNGSPVVFRQGGPRIRQGRVLIPLRGVLEKMGARVDWDGQVRAATVTLGENRVRLPLGSRTATLDARTVRLDVPAQSVQGRTMVPLRFVAEAFGAEVHWLASEREVQIATHAPVPERAER